MSWGTCESRNAERGTEVKFGLRAFIIIHWTGLTQKSVRCLFQCRTEAKHTYLFAKVACIACFHVLPRVGRGQRSRAYLMSPPVQDARDDSARPSIYFRSAFRSAFRVPAFTGTLCHEGVFP